MPVSLQTKLDETPCRLHKQFPMHANIQSFIWLFSRFKKEILLRMEAKKSCHIWIKVLTAIHVQNINKSFSPQPDKTPRGIF